MDLFIKMFPSSFLFPFVRRSQARLHRFAYFVIIIITIFRCAASFTGALLFPTPPPPLSLRSLVVCEILSLLANVIVDIPVARTSRKKCQHFWCTQKCASTSWLPAEMSHIIFIFSILVL